LALSQGLEEHIGVCPTIHLPRAEEEKSRLVIAPVIPVPVPCRPTERFSPCQITLKTLVAPFQKGLKN